jgi:HD-GYP domain-containing protein (c-di-GMP phosphodiesterase class II)
MVRFADLFKKKGKDVPGSPAPAPQQSIPQPLPEPPKKAVKQSDTESPRIRKVRVEEKEEVEIKENSEEIIIDSPKKISFSEAMKGKASAKPVRTETHPGGEDVIPQSVPGGKEPSPVQEISLADIIRKEDEGKYQRANKLYAALGESINKVINAFNLTNALANINYSELVKTIDEALNIVIVGDRTLLDLTYQCSSSDYLKFHMVNVGIISLYVGQGIGYNKSKLSEVAMLSFLHEIDSESIADSPDYKDIKTASQYSFLALRRIQTLAKLILPAVTQKPHFSESDMRNIADYARIIHMVDTYETLCRPAPHLKKLEPQAVMKELLKVEESFDKEILKMLIKLIGLYPIGSVVKLNTGEIARVVNINENSPLRPVVQILMDSEGRNLSEAKILDLSTNQYIYIAENICAEDLDVNNRTGIGGPAQ